eukprot:TRINITY_DN3953_c0_g1_i1.p1 TRINITY_DN3953_c0_g1~~TRINITY_DN3953_c0_g1_i1.p1  ORF type:complete len:57 (+),score=6.99 TRINITY_DN3953_c0_g1_i1:64-234(+)
MLTSVVKKNPTKVASSTNTNFVEENVKNIRFFTNVKSIETIEHFNRFITQRTNSLQ